jgi:hypothetical protein
MSVADRRRFMTITSTAPTRAKIPASVTSEAASLPVCGSMEVFGLQVPVTVIVVLAVLVAPDAAGPDALMV